MLLIAVGVAYQRQLLTKGEEDSNRISLDAMQRGDGYQSKVGVVWSHDNHMISTVIPVTC